MRHAVFTALLLVAIAGGRPAVAEPLRERPQAVVHGSDDRREVHEAPEAWARRARESVVVVVRQELLRVEGEGVVPSVSTAADRYRMCADEPFAGQPSWGECSGTLIDDDLVLTAAHCVPDLAACRALRFVFGWHYDAPDELRTPEAADVHGCAALAVVRRTGAPEQLDWAVVQLDRPAGPLRRPAPVEVSPVAVEVGSPVVVIGAGLGLPVKVDGGGRVVQARAGVLDYFGATSDTFVGSSGSGVFREDGVLVGVLARGEADFETDGGCRRLRRIPEGAVVGVAEESSYAHRAIRELCGRLWPSEALCGIGPSCGDGVCSPSESPDTCPGDCLRRVCGDGRCDPGEREGCVEDCAHAGQPPSSWRCPPGYWGAGDGCDCACGAPDPDCGDPLQRVANCDDGEVCDAAGLCVRDPRRPDVPEGWRCLASYWAAGDACDCGCGVRDPDCERATLPIYGCDEGASCDGAGRCVAPPIEPPPDAGPGDVGDAGVGDAGEVGRGRRDEGWCAVRPGPVSLADAWWCAVVAAWVVRRRVRVRAR